MDYGNAANERGEWSQADLAEGYRETAADREQEMEAEEWIEALIGDINAEADSNGVDPSLVSGKNEIKMDAQVLVRHSEFIHCHCPFSHLCTGLQWAHLTA
jgi:hypothetical protein